MCKRRKLFIAIRKKRRNFVKFIFSNNDDWIILAEDAEIDLGNFNQISYEPYYNFSRYPSIIDTVLHLDENQLPILSTC